MSYRDDLEANQARKEELERENLELKQELADLKKAEAPRRDFRAAANASSPKDNDPRYVRTQRVATTVWATLGFAAYLPAAVSPSFSVDSLFIALVGALFGGFAGHFAITAAITGIFELRTGNIRIGWLSRTFFLLAGVLMLAALAGSWLVPLLTET